MFRSLTLAAILCCANLSFAETTPVTILEIDTENIVSYSSDVFDASRFATDSNFTTATPARNFGFVLALGDIVAVNGKPAKGSLIARQQAVILNPTPSSGQGVADITRTAVTEFFFEIQQADGSPVGTVHTLTLSGGPAPLGLSGGASPLGAPLGSSHVVAGRTGAFLGVRGQGASVVLPGNTGPRPASITEDPARRRNHGGGKVHFVYHLIPLSRPEILITPTGPAVFHSDFSRVTEAAPARLGETLILRTIGLGPTRPSVNPGQPFPVNSFYVVNSPLEVTVNGRLSDVFIKIGEWGTTDLYRVDFQIPEGTAPGVATIQLSAAWIAGPEVKIPIR